MARILFVTWQYHPAPAGGAERQARLQAEELVRRGHQLTVVCPRAHGIGSGAVGGVRVVRLRRLPGQWPRRVSYLLNLLRFLLVHGRSHDVIHVHLANLQADVAVLAGRLVGTPVHVKVANSGSFGETRRLAGVARVTRWYGLRHARSVQALSEESVGELTRIGVPEPRIARIPNGVPLPPYPRDRAGARRRVALPSDVGLVLFAGRFARYKGLGDLLQAWEQCRQSGWTLLLVGEEAEDDPFGPIPDIPGIEIRPWATSVQDYLDAADIFVLPSHSEGMSNALLEAMATGRAVVSSRTGAATEMLVHGESGLMCGVGDAHGMADLLSRLMADPELRTRVAEGARTQSESFTVAAVVDMLEDAYKDMQDRA